MISKNKVILQLLISKNKAILLHVMLAMTTQTKLTLIHAKMNIEMVRVYCFQTQGKLTCSLIAFDGAKLTGERVFNVGASSSSLPSNRARKLVGGAVLIM
jgi:hypothetical protein